MSWKCQAPSLQKARRRLREQLLILADGKDGTFYLSHTFHRLPGATSGGQDTVNNWFGTYLTAAGSVHALKILIPTGLCWTGNSMRHELLEFRAQEEKRTVKGNCLARQSETHLLSRLVYMVF